MEVMGLMLGEFVDDYTVRVIDVFAMPQTGTVRFCIPFDSYWTKKNRIGHDFCNFCLHRVLA